MRRFYMLIGVIFGGIVVPLIFFVAKAPVTLPWIAASVSAPLWCEFIGWQVGRFL